MNYTIIIVAVTALISALSFRNRSMFYALSLNPYSIFRKNQWYRLITHGFVHADVMHLVINMLVLYSFGQYVEAFIGGNNFLIMYFTALVFSSLKDLFTKKDSYLYNSIGASGAVSAVVFASILFAPWSKIYFMAILPIPSIIFGVLYIWYEQYAGRRSGDNINHSAHIWGAVYGLLFPIIVKPGLFMHFINALSHPSF